MYRILLLVLIVNQISAQDSLKWLLQSEGESNDQIVSIDSDRSGNVAIAGWYSTGSLLIDSTLFHHYPDTATSSFFLVVDNHGNESISRSLFPGRIYNVDIIHDSSLLISGLCDPRYFHFGKDTFKNPSLDISRSVQSFISSISLENDLQDTAIFRSNGINLCDAQFYDSKSKYLWTGHSVNNTEKFTISDSLVFLDSLTWSMVLIKWSKELDPIQLIPIITDHRIENHSSIYVDHNENVYVAGSFRGNYIGLNNSRIWAPEGTQSLQKGFLLKINKKGSLIWGKIYNGASRHCGVSEVLGIDSTLILTGNFQGSGLFDNGDTLLMGFSDVSTFGSYWQSRLRLNGDINWINGMEMNSSVIAYSDISESGKILSHWQINLDTVDVLGRKFIRSTHESENTDNLLTIQDPDGDLIWAYLYGEKDIETTGPVKFTFDGDIIVSAGFKSDSMPFFGSMLYNDNPKDKYGNRPSNIFVARVSPGMTTSVFDVFPKLETLELQPNPSSGQFSIPELDELDVIKVFNTSAQEMQFSRTEDHVSLLNVTPGIYVVIVKHRDGSSRYGKLVIK